MYASSKASSTTRCQKCLQYGHYSFECKVTVQNRPYRPRPSRTQQLFNPTLQPQLSEENPLLQKAGIADAQLERSEYERRRRQDSADSVSTEDSVETISTDDERPRSPEPARKRRRADSHPGHETRQLLHDNEGRHRTKDLSRERDERDELLAQRPSIAARHRQRDQEQQQRRRNRPASRSSSPPRHRKEASYHRDDRRARSPRQRVNAALRSPSPSARRQPSRSPSPGHNNRYSSYRRRSRSRSPHRRLDREDNGHHPGRMDEPRNMRRRQYQHDDGGTVTYGKAPRQRSLSPFSKRAALTAAMGRTD
ncbi:MAG: hypothetical protein Q9159_002277 [Coniocarpon cinnabarinum]